MRIVAVVKNGRYRQINLSVIEFGAVHVCCLHWIDKCLIEICYWMCQILWWEWCRRSVGRINYTGMNNRLADPKKITNATWTLPKSIFKCIFSFSIERKNKFSTYDPFFVVVVLVGGMKLMNWTIFFPMFPLILRRLFGAAWFFELFLSHQLIKHLINSLREHTQPVNN